MTPKPRFYFLSANPDSGQHWPTGRSRIGIAKPAVWSAPRLSDTGEMSEPGPDPVSSARSAFDDSVDRFIGSIGTEVTPQVEGPLDRAVLDVFAHSIPSPSAGPVLDVGCGPGRVAAYLSARGLNVAGVDIAPRMIEAARAAHPEIKFEVGSLTDLGVPDQSLAGAVYWYSIIATPLDQLGPVWVELDRSLAKGGHVLVGFQSGDNDVIERPNAYGSSTTLMLYRHRVDDVIQSLAEAGFDTTAEIRREAEQTHETSPQAFLLAQRAVDRALVP